MESSVEGTVIDESFAFVNRRDEGRLGIYDDKKDQTAWCTGDALDDKDGDDDQWETSFLINVDRLDSDSEDDSEEQLMYLDEEVLEEDPEDKKGEPITLRTNYFKIACDLNKYLYKYKIKFEGDRPDNITELIKAHSHVIGPYIEERCSLYCTKKPPLELPLTDAENHIYLEFVNELEPQETRHLRMYEILMKRSLEELNFRMIGKCYYDLNSPRRIKNHTLEVCPGYMTAISKFDENVLIGVDVTHKVLSRMSVLDLLERAIEDHGPDYKDAFRTEVIGLSVWTLYDNKMYRIEGVTFSHSPLSQLPEAAQRGNMTYKEFFREKWGVEIQNSSQPMLIADDTPRSGRGRIEKCFLIPEVCAVAGLISSLKNETDVRSWIAAQRVVTPETRIERLEDVNHRLLSNPVLQREFEIWNMLMDSKLFEVSGRILTPQKLIFGGGCQADVDSEGNWLLAYNEKSFFHAKELRNWVVVTPSQYRVETQEFVAKVMKNTRNFHLSKPRWVELTEITLEGYGSTLDRAFFEFEPKAVMVITPGRHPDIYPAIIKKCYEENSVPCQVITDGCFTSDEQDDFAIKVAIQLNCKMGGTPWTIHMPLKRLMIVGVDVCQDKNDKNVNYISLIATLDRDLTHYVTLTSAYETDGQKTSCLTSHIFKALDKFRDANDNRLPSRIIIYRGSVLEREVRLITEHEVRRVHGALSRVYGDERRLKLSYILVSTNAHSKLFHGSRNPPLGTVVDSVITQPGRSDFYLVSHVAEDDTVSPTYYNVVHNSARLPLEKIEIISYKLTHMYFTNSHTIRVPAPLQYAHKLGALVANSLHTPPYSEIKNLYFV
ncbi:piwi-like protein Siwi [Diachasma alloeum]|uniref:piwi-like protein Siwi n=1 Tax=Diachasma alloeum TaxID=454923 RepID=UPI00073811C9|nr:piwi-like protein Siwi [Diachasma alloeum]XP_015121404.1 piwi-like protein Siwi [Diachasma alloeum]